MNVENFDDGMTRVADEFTAGEALSLCSMMGGCKCMTKSILSEDKTHYYCSKCGNTK